MEKMQYIGADHTKQTILIDGCRITASFTEEINSDVYRRVRDILMASSMKNAVRTVEKPKEG